ncbi:MAG: hypothetical protein AAB677_02900 [Patescibacteria group bacterium]
MKAKRSKRFLRQLSGLPVVVQKRFEKQLRFLLSNLRHPSLRTKKYDESQGIWQARVDGHYRFYFLIEEDIYALISITSHPD